MYSKLFVELSSKKRYHFNRMRPVGSEDYFDVRAFSIISDADMGVFTDLYLPLVGVTSFAIYTSLNHEYRLGDGLRKHGPFFAKLQLTSGQFRKGVEALEAVGLIKTYARPFQGKTAFLYGLYAPKDPASYFQNPLLLGTLRRYLGEDEVQQLFQHYHIENNVEGYEDVTGGFSDYFNPDFSDPVYGKGTLSAIPHKSGKIKTSFDFSAFKSTLKELGYDEGLLNKKDLSFVEKYASLYGYDGATMATLVYKNIDPARPMGQKLDFGGLEKACVSSVKFHYTKSEKAEKSQISSNSAIAMKIKMMDETAPIDFLSYLQGMKKPARTDIRLVQSLSMEIGLPNPAINALIDYVLQKNNNVLSSAYCEKLAAYLVRENVKTSRDAMDKLLSTSKGSAAKRKQEEVPVKDEENDKPQEGLEKTPSPTDDFDEFLNQLLGDEQ